MVMSTVGSYAMNGRDIEAVYCTQAWPQAAFAAVLTVQICSHKSSVARLPLVTVSVEAGRVV